MSSDSYVRYPNVRGDVLAFVAEDDVWVGSTAGGRAYRVSADAVPCRSPRLSPDGALVAWTATRGGASEVHVAPVDGGVARRLTFWGHATTLVRGWLSADELLVVSATGQAEASRRFAHAVPVDGGPSRRLDYGWADDLAINADGAVLLSTTGTVEPAWWKRYRGGTAPQLWLDARGDGEFRRVLADLESGLVAPLWSVDERGRQRFGFLSDHEGVAQVYSSPVGRPSVERLTRHTSHERYARHASGDGRQVVYEAGGELHLLESLAPDVAPRRIDVRLGGPRAALQPRPVPATASALGTVSPDRTGRASVIESRGTVQWVTHRDGPVRALAAGSGVRRRLPVVLGDTGRVAWVSDADGDDAIEIARVGGSDVTAQTLVPAGRVGRVLELAASPDGGRLAIAAHDGRLLTVTVPEGDVTRAARVRCEVEASENGDVSGLAFSPDSRWLAWSTPGRQPLRQLRMVDLSRGRPFDVTPLRFADSDPVFTADGKHLAFLSVRTFDPVYDDFVFDLSFPNGCRPHLIPLAADTPSPFAPMIDGRPAAGGGSAAAGSDKSSAAAQQPAAAAGDQPAIEEKPAAGDQPPQTHVDREGLDQRMVAMPVPAGRFSHLAAVKGGLVWLSHPLAGQLGDARARLTDDPARPTLQRIDLETGRVVTLAEGVDSVVPTGDGSQLVISDGDALRVVPADHKVDDAESPEIVAVDLSRIRVEVDPQPEWRQMVQEAWRLMRDHFWRADMGGVDWPGALAAYLPLVDRAGSRDDVVDLIWEMHGELGSSHAYCMPPSAGADPARRQGLLGADLEYAGGEWRIARIVPGEASEPRARSPLTAPGVGARPGDAIVAVDGRTTSRTLSPGALLVGTAGKPTELVLAPRGGGEPRRVVVVPLGDEFPLRYQDWVNGRRAYVHAATDGRVGYVHVPDMVSGGWAQLHRDLRTEICRDALIVDVRGNRGGHTSQLVVEKLARQIIGWDLARGYPATSYWGDARRGPMVTVTDMYAGSDGDIVTAAIRSLGLGPVVGTRTWGGVIGIDGRYSLVDGTVVTQPRFSFWFEKFGWGVENHGVDPDIEVPTRPQDHASDTDVQLDRALQIVERELRRTPAKQPPELPPLAQRS